MSNSNSKKYTPKKNQGSLHVGTEKQGCDFKGSYNHEGTVLELSGWRNDNGATINLQVWPESVKIEDRKLEKIDKSSKDFQKRNNTGYLFESKEEYSSDYYGYFIVEGEEVKVSVKFDKGAKGIFMRITKSNPATTFTDEEKASAKAEFLGAKTNSGAEVV